MVMFNLSSESCTKWIQYRAGKSVESYVMFFVVLLIFIFGLLGNFVLIIIILANKRMRTLPNFLIVNLAVGDTIFLLAHVLSTLPTYILSKFHADSTLCKLLTFTRNYTLGISIFTLMFLAIDRLRVIVCPLRRQLSPDQSRLFATTGVVGIWLTSTVLATPNAINSYIAKINISIENEGNQTICLFTEVCSSRADYHSYQEKIFQFWITFSAFFLIPFVVIGTCYTFIALYLMCHSRTPGNINSISTVQITSRKKLAKIVLGLIIIFLFCKLPEQIQKFWIIFYDVGFQFVQIMCEILTFVYPCLNPLTLCILSLSYRRQFISCIFRCKIDRGNDPRRNSTPLLTGQLIATTGHPLDQRLSICSNKIAKINNSSSYTKNCKRFF
uniref:GCR060 n=1 Tax=Schmidtea mediterranea TaxID=79327 RepID=A0A193KU91_SCHMD|nr:GCR060 [Schmidtea mediterranea]